MIINNSKTEETVVDFEKEAKVYLLSADEIRSKDMKLNGKVVMPVVSVAFVVV